MRILNISAQKPDSTGSGTYLSALVRSQLAAGCEPAVLCGAAPGDTQGDIPAGVPVYTVDFDTHEATVRGKAVHLTQLEIDLVRYFAANAGRVLSRDELLEHVWKLRNYPNTRTVDNFIVRLRRIFEADPAAPVYFLSVRGSGYRFVTEPLHSVTKA